MEAVVLAAQGADRAVALIRRLGQGGVAGAIVLTERKLPSRMELLSAPAANRTERDFLIGERGPPESVWSSVGCRSLATPDGAHRIPVCEGSSFAGPALVPVPIEKVATLKVIGGDGRVHADVVDQKQ